MLLRSSSTPVLGSLLSSFSETPNNSYSNSEVPNTPPHNYSKICYKHSHAAAGSRSLTKSLYNSSPISPSISELSGNNNHTAGGFRRAQSEGNLEGLVSASSNIDEFNFSIPTKKFSRRPPHYSTLEAIPSFSFHNSRNHNQEEGSEEEEEEQEEEEISPEENGLVYDCLAKKNLSFLKGDGQSASGYDNNNVGFEEEMYLARGLGISDLNFVDIGGHMGGGSGRGGGKDCGPVAFGGDGGDSNGFLMEEHYKRMLEENPSNALCLRNYAQFLHQTKKDTQGAEEYYSRAILADPLDGELLSQYAKLVWELYRDKDKATDYFERAVQAAAQDSHVQAAYASFLWETDTDDEEDDQSLKTQPMLTLLKEGVAA